MPTPTESRFSGQTGRSVAASVTAALALFSGVSACTADAERSPTSGATALAGEATTAAATPFASPSATAAAPGAGAQPSFAEAWERAPDAPVELTEVAAAAHDGTAWVVGGFTADGAPSSEVLIFDPDEMSWRSGPALPDGVHHAALVSTRDQLIVVGGFVGGGFEAPTDAVWVIAGEDGEWQPGPALPQARGAGAAAWDGRRVVFGGGVGPDGVASDVYVLEDGGWRPVGHLSEPRQHLAATSNARGRVWFLAGRHSSLVTNMGSVDLLENGEVVGQDVALTPRSGVGAFWTDAVGACLVGGEGPNGTLADVECVADDGQVTSLPSLGVARHGLGVVLLPDGAYALLGGEQPGLFVSAVVERLPLE